MNNPPSPEFAAKIEKNEWESSGTFDSLINTIKELLSASNKWSWLGNNRCKYIEIRIDMRDGGFVLLDRDGSRISFDQLKWQYKRESTPKEDDELYGDGQ